MQGEKVLYSTGNGEYGTPQDLFDALNEEFRFVLDPAATHDNAKCDQYFTKDEDGLKQDWSQYGSVFLNPPYGEPEQPCRTESNFKFCTKKRCEKRGYHVAVYQPGIIDWMRKAWQESEKWKRITDARTRMQKMCTVVCLVPARTDTEWWHRYAMQAYEIRFIEGRLKFELPGANWTATFPSAIVVLNGYRGVSHGSRDDPWAGWPLIKAVDRQGKTIMRRDGV